MNPWIALIIGLIAGWLIELLIDVFYWRKRRLCPDDTALNLRASLEQAQSSSRSLQISLAENQDRLGQLEGDLAARDGRITALTADLDARTGEIDGLNGRIHQLEAALIARDNELEIVRTELGGIDAEAKDLGFGSIFAGGGLALGTFWHNLKARFSGLNADVAARDAQIGGIQAQVEACGSELEGLKAQVETLEIDLAARDAQIGNLQVELDNKTGQLGKLETELDAKNVELGRLHAELGDIDAEVKGLGLGSLFAGSGLALRGFFGNLKERFSGEAELETRSAELDASLTTKAVEIEELRAELDAKTTALNSLEAELDAKNVELGRLHAELGDIDAEVKGLGLGSLFAGSGLALRGFFGNLKERFSGEAELETRSTELDAALVAKDAEIDGLRLQVGDLEQKLSVCSASLVEMRANLGAEYKGAQGLSMVWGLNTAANDVLANHGVYTYNQLAATRVDEVNDAIEISGEYYPDMDNVEIHNSWVEQSRLAGSGNWDDLFTYQQERFDLVSLRDDLKKIWGIGPKIEQVLNENGVYLFAQLASVPADRITEILRRAGSRFQMSTGKLHDTWPEQARLADKGDWDAFKALHDSFDWSKVQGE